MTSREKILEGLDALDVCDQGSAGCTVALAECMDVDSMEVIKAFLSKALDSYFEARLMEILPEKMGHDNKATIREDWYQKGFDDALDLLLENANSPNE